MIVDNATTDMIRFEVSESSDYWTGFHCLKCRATFSYSPAGRLVKHYVKENVAPEVPLSCPSCGRRIVNVFDKTNDPESDDGVVYGPRRQRIEAALRKRDHDWLSYEDYVYTVKTSYYSPISNKVSWDYCQWSGGGREILPDDPLCKLKVALENFRIEVARQEKENYFVDELTVHLVRYKNRHDKNIYSSELGDGKVLKSKTIKRRERKF